MTKDDIPRMAREAGFNVEQGYLLRITGIDEDLERFAALVAAAERNILAAWMIQRGYATGHGDTMEDLLKELEWQIAENWTNALVKGVEGEREACARVCESTVWTSSIEEWRDMTKKDVASKSMLACADAIRARGAHDQG